jgi:hypothetical protein
VITRRSLLLAGTGAAAAAAIPSVAEAAAKKLGERFRPHLLRSSYERLAGTDFKVGAWGAAPIRLRLVEVRDIPNLSKQTADFKERSFVLVFQGPAGSPLAAETYRFSHKRLGKFELAISSVTAGSTVIDYAVVIANARRAAKPKKRVRKHRKHASKYKDRKRVARAEADAAPAGGRRSDFQPVRPRTAERRAAETGPAAAPPEPSG